MNLKNIVIKILLIIALFEMICMPISNAFTFDDIFNQGNNFITGGMNQEKEDEKNGTDGNKDFNKIVKQVYNVVVSLGVALSVIIGAILGIKFMTGSIEEQAKVKELLAPYVSGCIVTFGAFGIWGLMMSVLKFI